MGAEQPWDDVWTHKTWEHAGLRCAIVWSPMAAFNGYIQLHESSADLMLTQAAEVMDRELWENDPDRIGSRYFPHAYDLVDIDCPGGLTYGPDDDGWVGFDTNHHDDIWDDDVISEILLEAAPHLWEEFLEKRALYQSMGLGGWPLNHGLRMRYGGMRHWTMPKLIEAVEYAAAQIADRNSPPVRRQ